tara:strand:+ start:624 stop:1238 length:615 start_codon:yes stop_codon:yes gene_type:complete
MDQDKIMSVDYEQLKLFVKEAMFTGGGINEPSAPEGIPHRMPAADTAPKSQELGDPEANRLYDVALAAREAAEILVEALDDPTYDAAYEHAFKASACLRRVLNSLENTGAHPMPQQRVVAPPKNQQPYNGGGAGDYAGGAGGVFAMGDGGGGAMEEEVSGQGIPNQVQSVVDEYLNLEDAEQSLFDGLIAGHKGAQASPGKGLG